MSIRTDLFLLRRRRTKIVATLGPSSSSPTVIASLIEAGVDMFRLNMSHGDHAGHQATYASVRAAAEQAGKPIAILADLCGPKIRAGRFAGGSIDLVDGEPVTVTTRDVLGAPGLIPSQYKALAEDVAVGDRILLDDGTRELRVEGIEGSEIRCTVLQGGVLSDRKGINLPGVAISTATVTEKDRIDARFAQDLGVDYLALSFVRCRQDVEELRGFLNESGVCPPIISKIEKPEALRNIDGILAASDGLMVARGDLGVEVPAETVPLAQEELIDLARAQHKPVIVATQMLDSMIRNARPTRAEVSDVAVAVRSGADAVMLSGETAAGAHPVAAVRIMDRIARQTEAWQWSHGHFGGITRDDAVAPPLPMGAAMARSVAQLSRDLEVRMILVLSQSGASGRLVSSARPAAPVLAASRELATLRRMNLLWGVVPVFVTDDELDGDLRVVARDLARDYELAEPGQAILLVRGFHPEAERNRPSVEAGVA